MAIDSKITALATYQLSRAAKNATVLLQESNDKSGTDKVRNRGIITLEASGIAKAPQANANIGDIIRLLYASEIGHLSDARHLVAAANQFGLHIGQQVDVRHRFSPRKDGKEHRQMPSKIINRQTSGANRNWHFRGTLAATTFIYARQASIHLGYIENPRKTRQSNLLHSPFTPQLNHAIAILYAGNSCHGQSKPWPMNALANPIQSQSTLELIQSGVNPLQG
jgi:hypothetical protein